MTNPKSAVNRFFLLRIQIGYGQSGHVEGTQTQVWQVGQSIYSEIHLKSIAAMIIQIMAQVFFLS